ncbi:MAG: DUF2752 domain-containing protein [Chthoniobacteraceae bacterium]
MTALARQLVWGTAALGAAALLFHFNPAGSGLYPPCPFHALTGCYCPGCGSLRAAHELLHLHFAAAWQLNPLMVAALPVLALALVTGSPVNRAFRHPAAPWVAGGIIVAFWILRNLPFAPFNLLSPH